MTGADLGAEHRADRRRLLAAFRDGDPCWRCGQPMHLWQGLDRGHIVSRALGGADGPAALEHRSCNVRAGARLGNALRQQAGQPANRGRRHRAPQVCVICGRAYLPSRAGQLACGRACGWELRRRNAARGTVTSAQRATVTSAAATPPAARQASRNW